MTGTHPPAAADEDHDARLGDGWATWEGGRDLIQGMWPDDRIGPDEHAHAHSCGPYFNHSHRQGRVPHDHEPDDTRIPAQCRTEFREGRR